MRSKGAVIVFETPPETPPIRKFMKNSLKCESESEAIESRKLKSGMIFVWFD